MARPFVKWAAEVRRLADLPRAVHRGAKTALAPPTGSVFLSLPADVLNEEGEVDLGQPTRVASRLRGDRAAVEAAAELLARSERPLIMAGDAVAQSGALEELVVTAELLGAPVYMEGIPSTASFPSSHPLFCGTFARQAPAIRPLLAAADVLFSVGADLLTPSFPYEEDPVPPDFPIVHLDIDPWELGKNYPARVAILGDAKATLPDLAAALEARLTPGRRAQARRRLEEARASRTRRVAELVARAEAEARQPSITPPAAMHEVAEALPPDTVVVEEAISSAVGLREFLRSDDAKSFFANRGGGIGWGLPAALGVKLALPDRPVVGLIGDGSAMYTCQALWTAAHLGLSVVLVILNNASYRILKQRIHAMKGLAAHADRYIGMDIGDPPVDFVGLARALGAEAERVDKADGIRPALAGAPGASRPHPRRRPARSVVQAHMTRIWRALPAGSAGIRQRASRGVADRCGATVGLAGAG